MSKLLAIFLLIIMLSSCGLSNLLGAFGGGTSNDKSIGKGAQLGQTNKQTKGISSETKRDVTAKENKGIQGDNAQSYNGSGTTNVHNGYSSWVMPTVILISIGMFLLFIAWLIWFVWRSGVRVPRPEEDELRRI